jgi:rfaE bifunctional protein nucleotidyltransferase chain/domain
MPSPLPPRAPQHAHEEPSALHPSAAPEKVLSLEQLLALRARARAEGKTVVQCHGCFDIVHPGHIRHLRFARSQGDILLVSITGDTEMRKGTGRPLIPEELRAENLAALDCVDWVYIDGHPTARELLEAVQPDVYVKGRDYESNQDPRFAAERQAVERRGGRVVFSSGDVIFSSTALIAAMENSIDPYHARLARLLDDPQLEGSRLTGLVSAFRGKRVLVIGEAIRDTYVLCDRPAVAGECPVMTLRPVERLTYDGGAAIIARHLAAMGAQPTLLTVLPASAEAEALRQRLAAEGVTLEAIDADWAIPEKQRFLSGGQKIMKLDLVEPLTLDARQQDGLIATAESIARSGGGADAAIISDYGLGMFSPGLLGRLIGRVRPHTRIMAGDVSGRRSHLRCMTQMDLLTPSESELRESLRMFDESLPAAVWSLLQSTGAARAIVTMGPEGLIAFDRLPGADAPDAGDGFQSRVSGEHVPALVGHAIDALGCGDSLLAAATLTLAAGGSLLAAGFLGAVAAAAQAQRIGNIVISATDLRHGIVRIHASHLTYTPPDRVAARGARSVAVGA